MEPGNHLCVCILIRIDPFGPFNHFLERHRYDPASLGTDHATEVFGLNLVNGRNPKAGSEDPILCCRAPATLNVAEYCHPRLDPEPAFQFFSEEVSDTNKFFVSAFIPVGFRYYCPAISSWLVPSATTTIENFFPARYRALSDWQISSIDTLTSGTRI